MPSVIRRQRAPGIVRKARPPSWRLIRLQRIAWTWGVFLYFHNDFVWNGALVHRHPYPLIPSRRRTSPLIRRITFWSGEGRHRPAEVGNRGRAPGHKVGRFGTLVSGGESDGVRKADGEATWPQEVQVVHRRYLARARRPNKRSGSELFSGGSPSPEARRLSGVV